MNLISRLEQLRDEPMSNALNKMTRFMAEKLTWIKLPQIIRALKQNDAKSYLLELRSMRNSQPSCKCEACLSIDTNIDRWLFNLDAEEGKK